MEKQSELYFTTGEFAKILGVIDWGSMVSEGRTSFGLAPGLVLYPMLFIFLCVLSFNLLGRQLESGGRIDA